MNLEDEMYRVMAALSAGDVPVDFKGADPDAAKFSPFRFHNTFNKSRPVLQKSPVQVHNRNPSNRSRTCTMSGSRRFLHSSFSSSGTP